MDKKEFLAKLQRCLRGLPERDILQWLDYYGEMLDERIEDGMSEADAAAAMGEPQEIAKKILEEIPMLKLVKERVKPKRALRAWEIVLLILGSPIWLSLLVVALAVLITVYAVLWSVWIAFCAVAVAVFGGAVGGVVLAVVAFLQANGSVGVVYIGGAVVLLGLGVLTFYACGYLLKGILIVSKKTWLFIKSCFVKRRAKQ
jgi:uncharacterized membrane protein